MTLNMWGGILSERFPDFFDKHKDVDIFCFQEVYRGAQEKKNDEFIKIWDISKDSLNLFEDLKEILPEYVGYFRPHVEDFYGLAIFVRKNIAVVEEGDIWIYGTGEYKETGVHSRNLQYVDLKVEDVILRIANVHGIWIPETDKLDIPERLEQTRIILEFLKQKEIPVVLVGDFNLRPETQSLQAIEREYTNLLPKYGITDTRTSFYTKECRYADYVFVSDDIKDTKLEVATEEVSDHAALVLDFEL